MSRAAHAFNDLSSLRQRALTQLTGGIRGNLERASMSQALAVLHQLASSPDTAGDALALLHELQVHQVEVDLQQEEMRDSRVELESALNRQTALIERAPVGCLIVDARTVICEINPCGARLLGAARDDLLGQPLASFMSAHGADMLQTMLARARDGLAPETCHLRLLPVAGVARDLHATADTDDTPGRFLVALMLATSPIQSCAA